MDKQIEIPEDSNMSRKTGNSFDDPDMPAPDKESCLEYKLSQAEEKIAKLEAVVDKLPKYADTGEPFVATVDLAWFTDEQGYAVTYYYRGSYTSEFACIDGKWYILEHQGKWVDLFYSTEEAAEAAK